MKKKLNSQREKNVGNSKQNLGEIKESLQELKKEYEIELNKYKKSSLDILNSEKKFNELSKKINKIEYKQIEISNKIDDSFIKELNNYKIEPQIKNIFLTLLGFTFPNEEPFYFNSPESLIAQLSLSKEFLFELSETKKKEFEIIKSLFINLNKINNFIPICEYIKLNFDVVDLLKSRKIILEENNEYIKIKDTSFIKIKMLEKKIKEKYDLIKNNIKHNKNDNNFKTQKTKDNEINNSNLLSVKDFDEISGKSIIMSLTNNDNTSLDLLNEDAVNYKINNIIDENIHQKKFMNSYNNESQTNCYNNEIDENNYLPITTNYRTNAGSSRFSKSPNITATNNNINDINDIKNQTSIELVNNKHRSPLHKIIKGKDSALKIEKSYGDNGCCTSCT